MSQAHHQSLNVLSAGIDGHPYPPESALAQTPQSVSNFVDGSGPIFSMYLEMATEEDKKMVENWKADADGILIFTGLFSAAVASLISVSIQDIRQDPQDTSNFYLANIYQTLADPNRPNISSSLPASPPPFSPPNYAVWVNALWFLSLVISLTCALLATLLQQWARKYLKVTQPRYAPHKRARIRAFLAEGIEKLLLPWTVEALPSLLHVSLFLFFAGLVVFIWNIDLTIFKLVLSWVSICTALYGCITVIPIFRHDSPYHTPLSLPAWHVVTGTLFFIYRVLRWFNLSVRFRYYAFRRFRLLEERYRNQLVKGMVKTVEEAALKSPPEIDTRAFLWTFDSSDEDHELERFFSGLPGFRDSTVVRDPLPGLAEERKEGLFTALSGLLDRSFSSDLLPDPVKHRRAIICARAVDPAHTTEASSVLHKILSKYRYGDPVVTETLQVVRGWNVNLNRDAAVHERATFSEIVARVQPRNDPWFILASKSLGVSEDILRGYAAHGDSLSLAILIHVTRQQFSHFWENTWPQDQFCRVLYAASEFHVRDTLPELQHEFCALWNVIVRKVQKDPNSIRADHTLGHMHNVYLALHQSTDSAQFSASTGNGDFILSRPPSYPTCNVPGHHPDSTPHIYDDSVSADFAPSPYVPPIPNGDDIYVPPEPSVTGSDYSSSSLYVLRIPHGDEYNFVPPDPSVAGSDHSSSSPESRLSLLVPGSPGPSRPWSSAPDLSAAAKGEGSAAANTALRKEKDAPYHSSKICEDIKANPDLLLRSPSPPPVPTLCVDEGLTDASPLDNDISVPISLQLVERATTESCRIRAASPIPANTRTMHGSVDTPAGTLLLSTPKLSAIAPPKSEASTSPPDTVAIEHPTDSRTPSLDDPSSPSLTQVLTTALLVPDAPFTSPPPPSTSAPDLCAAPEDEHRASLCRDKDALHTSSTIHEAITAVPDLPPQSLSPPSVSCVTFTDP